MIFLLTDEMFVRGLTNAAKVHAKFATNSTFMYRFAYDGALGLYKRLLNVNRPGICHGDELGYLFYFGIFNVNLDPSSSETNTKKRMVKMWTNFVKYGWALNLKSFRQTETTCWVPRRARPTALCKCKKFKLAIRKSFRQPTLDTAATIWALCNDFCGNLKSSRGVHWKHGHCATSNIFGMCDQKTISVHVESLTFLRREDKTFTSTAELLSSTQ